MNLEKMDNYNNEILFCKYCNNIMFIKYEDNLYNIHCISCNYKLDISDNQIIYESNEITDTKDNSTFYFDENDIIYDYSLSRIFIDNDEYVSLNDKNMKKIYINIKDKSIHLNQVELKKSNESKKIKKLEEKNIDRIRGEYSTSKSEKSVSKKEKSKKEKSKKEKSEKSKSIERTISVSLENGEEDYKTFNMEKHKDKDVFFYYSKSADKKAGEGSNEYLVSKDNKYKELNEIDDWRKMLSNFYYSPFKFIFGDKTYTYNTAEHAFQGTKFLLLSKYKSSKPEDNIFCVESGSKIGTSTNGEVARENRKLYVLNQGELILWNNRKYDILEQILTAKFSQNEKLKKVLLITGDAILTHGNPRQPKTIVRQVELEKVREKLK